MIVIFSFPIRNLCHLSFGFDCVEIFKQFNSIKLLVGVGGGV